VNDEFAATDRADARSEMLDCAPAARLDLILEAFKHFRTTPDGSSHERPNPGAAVAVALPRLGRKEA
jgi:hypothetical protein